MKTDIQEENDLQSSHECDHPSAASDIQHPTSITNEETTIDQHLPNFVSGTKDSEMQNANNQHPEHGDKTYAANLNPIISHNFSGSENEDSCSEATGNSRIRSDSFKMRASALITDSFSFLPQSSVEEDEVENQESPHNLPCDQSSTQHENKDVMGTARQNVNNDTKPTDDLSDSFKSRASAHITASFSFLPIDDDPENQDNICKSPPSSKHNEYEESSSFKKRASKQITDSFSFLPIYSDELHHDVNLERDKQQKTSNVDEAMNEHAQNTSNSTTEERVNPAIYRSREKRDSIKNISRDSRQAILSVQGDKLDQSLDEVFVENDKSSSKEDAPTQKVDCVDDTGNHIANPPVSPQTTISTPQEKLQQEDKSSPIVLRSPKSRWRVSHGNSPTLQRLRSRSRSHSPAISEGSDEEEDEEEGNRSLGCIIIY